MLTVAAVARRLGVAPATLRTWDRRYGVGPTEHTSGAHRRYSPGDIARLDVMRRLIRSGVSPAEAARVASAPAAERPAEGLEDHAAGEPAAESSSGGGRVIAMPASSRTARGLARAAMALDSAAATEIVSATLARHGVVWTWQQVVLPVLDGIGRRWATTGEGIEVEHLLSECVIVSLARTHSSIPEPVNARPVLLAAAEDELHTLPLYVLAGALSERQISSRVLGARVPADALADAVRRSGPAAVFVWSQLRPTGDPAKLLSLPRMRPAPVVVVGGPGWAAQPPGTVLAGDLDDAVALIADAVGA